MGCDVVRSTPRDFQPVRTGPSFLCIPTARGSASTYLVDHLRTQVVSQFSGCWRFGLTRCVLIFIAWSELHSNDIAGLGWLIYLAASPLFAIAGIVLGKALARLINR